MMPGSLPLKLGKYTLLEELGSGAFGTVYRATDPLGRTVAVKVLKPALVADPAALARFQQEARQAGELFHPRIASILDFDEADGRVFFAMRYVAGESLDRALKRRGALPFMEAVEIIAQVAEALDYAHARGLVHRDVKPANIILGPDGAVLTDFGLVRAATDSGLSTSGAMLGTPAYMAPEIWLEQPSTPQTDIYALGCVLFELVSGQVLFAGDTAPAVMKRHFDPLALPASWPASVPADFEALLRAMLAQESSTRPASAGECARRLQELLAPTAIDSPEIPQSVAMSPARPLTQPWPSPYWVLATVVVVIGVGLAWLATRGPAAMDPALITIFATTSAPAAPPSATNAALATFTSTPPPTVSPVPTDTPLPPIDYKVAAGDTCVTIAAKYNVSPQSIILLNHLDPDCNLSVGRDLLIPLPTAGPTLTPPPFHYKVAAGDTCVTIAAKYNVSSQSIILLNHLDPDCNLSVGRDLLIPPPTSVLTPPLASPTPSLSIGSTQISPADGMVLLYVPAGNFLMGSADSDPNAQANEKPQHTVYLDAFWIDRTDVTNAMYARCVAAGACQAPSDYASATRSSFYDNPAYVDYPVNHVSWNDANNYCTWAGLHLPTEAEREKAARGMDGRLYPWGNNAPDDTLLNYNRTVGDTTAVGHYPKGVSPYGVMDMAGNVREWVGDWYADGYYAQSSVSNPTGPLSGQYRVLRGGAWYDMAQYVRAANRLGKDPGDRFNYYGFRCARSFVTTSVLAMPAATLTAVLPTQAPTASLATRAPTAVLATSAPTEAPATAARTSVWLGNFQVATEPYNSLTFAISFDACAFPSNAQFFMDPEFMLEDGRYLSVFNSNDFRDENCVALPSGGCSDNWIEGNKGSLTMISSYHGSQAIKTLNIRIQLYCYDQSCMDYLNSQGNSAGNRVANVVVPYTKQWQP